MSALLSANEIRLTYEYQTLLDGITRATSAGERTGMAVARPRYGKCSPASKWRTLGKFHSAGRCRSAILPKKFELDSELSVTISGAHG
jgi:ABC transport system ATP-binding/permease protein